MASMSGDIVLANRYRLERQIGRGGMGQVWSAVDTRLQRRVAVKTVDLAATGDEVAAERFQQEAHATAALSHPNIVTIFDNGVDGHTAYLVMELLSGPSLDELVRDQGPLPVDRALAYTQEVASALGAAHRAGVVHRDVKPSNLMLDERGTLKMVDFGIARLDQARTSQLTATATVIGSAPYLSPEQATGGTATPQSDLYSLGCVLMTLLTSEPPFEGEHPLSILHHHLSTPPPLPSERRPGVPQAVDDLVAQLLAKSPQDRPASAADVAGRIAAIRRGAAPSTTVLPVAGAAAAATTVLPPAGGGPPPPPRPGTPAPGAPGGAARPPRRGRGGRAPPPPPRPVTQATAYRDEPDRPRRRGMGALWVMLLLLAATVGALWWFVLRGTGPSTDTPTVPTPTATSTTARTTAPTRTTSAPTVTVTQTPTQRPTSSAPTTPTQEPTTPTEQPTTPTEQPSTPTEEPSDPAPTWTGSASAAASTLGDVVQGAQLSGSSGKDASKSLRSLDKAIRQQDAGAARAALGELSGAVQSSVQDGSVSSETAQSITSAADAVAGALPAA